MKYLIATYREWFRNRQFLGAFFLSFLFLAISLIVNFYAGIYATESISNSVTDIVLSNIRVFDLDAIFLYGPFIFWIIMIIVHIKNPEKFPFALKTIALFVVIRSVFMTLTHLGPFPGATPVDLSGVMGNFTFGGDLFFSAHTGLPFLAALMFWNEKIIRSFCIVAAVFFGIVVLLAHLHYSIDVLAAFFITYSIYKIATVFFKKDLQMFTYGKNT